MAIILIPTPYRKHTGSHSRLDYPGHTVREILDSVESQYPGFSPCIMDEQHRVHRHIILFLNGEDIRYLQGLDTLVIDTDTLDIIPAIAGG